MPVILATAAIVALILLFSKTSEAAVSEDFYIPSDDSGDIEEGLFMPEQISPMVEALAIAIAHAEGYLDAKGNVTNPPNRPVRLNNPGDLTDPNNFQLIQFPNAQAGWDALYKKITRMLTGASRVYPVTMTITQLADKYTGMDNPRSWEKNVLFWLAKQGYTVSAGNTLGDLANVEA